MYCSASSNQGISVREVRCGTGDDGVHLCRPVAVARAAGGDRGGRDARAGWAGGDLYRAARAGVSIIGLVDGYFEAVPSVSQKEILWALSHGIHVYGSVSIGALRAVELEPFGMRGVGRVFEAFRDGVLRDDDEVALLHGPAEAGYPPVTEAMVNIWATTRGCRTAGSIRRGSMR
jgi:hypothetical protein